MLSGKGRALKDDSRSISSSAAAASSSSLARRNCARWPDFRADGSNSVIRLGGVSARGSSSSSCCLTFAMSWSSLNLALPPSTVGVSSAAVSLSFQAGVSTGKNGAIGFPSASPSSPRHSGSAAGAVSPCCVSRKKSDRNPPPSLADSSSSLTNRPKISECTCASANSAWPRCSSELTRDVSPSSGQNVVSAAAIMDSFSLASSLLRRRSDSLAHSSASLSVLPSSDMVRCDCVAFVGQLTGEDEVRSSGLCVEAT